MIGMLPLTSDALLLVVLGVVLVPTLHFMNVLIGLIIQARLRSQLSALTRGKLVLSYDDGPSERLHPRILKLLAAAEIPASFYVLTSRAEVHRSQLQATRDGGHEVASHGFAHLDARRASARLVWNDIAKSLHFLRAAGIGCETFRPPYGRVTLSTAIQLARQHCSLALWTHESGDTYGRRPSVSSVVEQVDRDGGGVILLHTHDRSDPVVEDYVAELTAALIELGKRRGFEFTTCAALLRAR